MSEGLPLGWAATTLGDVCDAAAQVRPSDVFDSEFVYLDISSVDNKRQRFDQPCVVSVDSAPSRARQLVKAGDTLFSTVRTNLKNIAIVETRHDGQICSTGFAVLRPKSTIDARYLFHYVTHQSFVEQISTLQRGVSYPAVRDADVRAQPLPLAPLNEQRRIVERIDELFSQIEAGEAALARAKRLLERYRQAILKAAVTGELTKDWRERNKEKLEPAATLLTHILQARRQAWEEAELAKMRAKGKEPKDDRWKERYKEPVAPNMGDLPGLPNGWIWASLPLLGEFGRGKSKHRPRNDPRLFGGNYPFIQTGEVRSSRGRITKFAQAYNETGLGQSKLWPTGTICITIAANIANTGVLEFDACFPDSVVGLVPIQNINGRFVEFFLRTVREEIDSYAPATAQKNINLDILSEMTVPLPCTLEQDAIADEMEMLGSEIDSLDEYLQTANRRVASLRQSVLTAAFAGKLVPQDPADEPASAVLARIRGTRKAEVRPHRSRRTRTDERQQGLAV